MCCPIGVVVFLPLRVDRQDVRRRGYVEEAKELQGPPTLHAYIQGWLVSGNTWAHEPWSFSSLELISSSCDASQDAYRVNYTKPINNVAAHILISLVLAMNDGLTYLLRVRSVWRHTFAYLYCSSPSRGGFLTVGVDVVRGITFVGLLPGVGRLLAIRVLLCLFLYGCRWLLVRLAWLQ